MPIVKNKSTEENRDFWSHVEDVARRAPGINGWSIMRRASHTPGPWRRGKSPRAVYREHDGHWKKICSVGIYGQTTSEDMANASLIIAAPAMESALRAIAEGLLAIDRDIWAHLSAESNAIQALDKLYMLAVQTLSGIGEER